MSGEMKASRLSKKLGKINLSEETEMTLRRIQVRTENSARPFF